MKRNCSKGFQVGQTFQVGWRCDSKVYGLTHQVGTLYTVVKVGAMVTFECQGKLIRRKPKFIKGHFHYDYDDDRVKGWRDDNWSVDLDKDKKLTWQDIYSPKPVEAPVRVVKRVPMKKPAPEPESDDEDDVPLAVIASRLR